MSNINGNENNIAPVFSRNYFIGILLLFLILNFVGCCLAKVYCSDNFIELMKMMLFLDVLTIVLAKILIKYVKAGV